MVTGNDVHPSADKTLHGSSQPQRSPSFHQNSESEKIDGDRNERRGDEKLELNKVVTERDVCINDITAEGRGENQFLADVSEQRSTLVLLEDTHMGHGTLLVTDEGSDNYLKRWKQEGTRSS
ncbi:hypothetical protein Adt_12687 [Abeliophyllum distichum]|uniref:Uncharacterized protein n=1 Tax=Abeliophyllum distichum TaxID=126358 RepID=A0ABD1USF5_9LAMI